MRRLKHINDFLSERLNPRLISKKNKPYEILIKYEHGDADAITREVFSFEEEEEFINVIKFFYECMNFTPNVAYGKLGTFHPIPAEANNGRSSKENVWRKITEIGTKHNLHEDSLYEYIKRDVHYHDGYADIDGIKIRINGEDKVLVFLDALETNKIILPNIGDILNINPNNISGYGPSIFGGTYKDYLPNSGKKDYIVDSFDAKVIDCSINFMHKYENQYYTSYTGFHYVLLLEALEDVLKDNVYCALNLTSEKHGWDPNFEEKFNKEKYDDMNYYEIKL